MNEINMHLLEATYVHLYFTRGPPESLNNSAAAGGDGMFVQQDGYSGGNKSLPHMTPNARKVFQQLQNAPQNNEGLHVRHIAAECGMPVNDVFKAGDELLGLGIIYTTVDDETWAVLEY
jgi:replication factor A2